MSEFDAMFHDGADALLDVTGEAISYTAPGGTTATEIERALVGEEQVVEIGARDGRRSVVTRQVTIGVDPTASTFCGVESPVRQATVAIGSVSYYVDQVLYGDVGGLVTLQLRRVGQVQKSSEHYERR